MKGSDLLAIFIFSSIWFFVFVHDQHISHQNKIKHSDQSKNLTKLQTLENQNKNRIELLREKCKNWKSRNLDNTPSAVYIKDGFHEHSKINILLCAAPKTGCTSWKKDFLAKYHRNFTNQDKIDGKEFNKHSTKPKNA